MAQHLFFDSSRHTLKQITDVFDFLWPTSVAMWNLRWQVEGYLKIRPDASAKEIENRFALGSGMSANLQKACSQHSWEQQQEEFAKILLINLTALYESWIAQTLNQLEIADKKIEKELQFPTSLKNGRREGVWNAIDQITTPESTMLRDAFYRPLTLHRKNSKGHLDNLFKCYRYFKECRNTIAHAGGIADTKALEAYLSFSAIANKSDLGLTEVPKHSAIALNNRISLHLRGVVGFGEAIQRIIPTIDAELSRAKKAEKVFDKYWRKIYPNGRVSLKTNEYSRKLKIIRLMNTLGLPKPEKTEDLEAYLLQKKWAGW